MKLTTSILAIAALGLAACGGNEEAEAPAEAEMVTPEEAAPEPVEETVDVDVELEVEPDPTMDAIAAAVAHPDRPADEVENDASRMPAATLRFAGIEEGMTIMELEAGGGYFTEILSRAVGPEGKVYMQNPQSFDTFLGDSLERRLGNDRLPNVVVMRTNFDNLEADDESVDVVTWIQGPHELWFSPDGETSLGDPETSFAEIARVLKPGGAFVAIDHRAADGAGPEVGGTLHRIEASIIQTYAEDAGLVLGKTSDMLANPEDPLTIGVFDPSIRGNTDQFVLYF
ncbi:MAG: methyltransferase domain-containing protein, partial [Pseudomonadota bacterium]